MSKKQPKLTPWFPAEVKPVRVGVYMKDFGARTIKGYQYWDGSRWYYGEQTPDKTIEKLHLNRRAFIPSARPWRGLAVKP